MGKIYSLVKFTFSPVSLPHERELANFGHVDRDCVHFLKRCYRINGSTLHPSADISDLPSDIRMEISDSPCTDHKTRCASYKNIRKKVA